MSAIWQRWDRLALHKRPRDGLMPSKNPILSTASGHLPSGQRSPLDREVDRLAATLGASIREERKRRNITIRGLAAESGLSKSFVHDVELGEPASLAAYARIARAIGLRPEFRLVDPRGRERTERGMRDLVHAAMGEAQAARFRRLGFQVRIDEPYQHYQFAGRADVVACATADAALLHIENKTEIDDVQAIFGSFNAKRAYLGGELADRLGVERWRSETHVFCALWSADLIRIIRRQRSSFEAVWPDQTDAFEAWWAGTAPAAGRRSILVMFDPIEGVRTRRRRWVGLQDLGNSRPRYRDYADAARALAARNRANE